MYNSVDTVTTVGAYNIKPWILEHPLLTDMTSAIKQIEISSTQTVTNNRNYYTSILSAISLLLVCSEYTQHGFVYDRCLIVGLR
jgi:hypothetical protein